MKLLWLINVMVLMKTEWCKGQQDDGLIAKQLHSRINDLETTVELLLSRLLDIQDSTEESKTDDYLDVGKRGRIDVFPGGEVGFHVLLNNNVYVFGGKKIPFEIEATNIGDAYNERSAQFTCPRAGTYIFSLTISCEKGSYVEAYVEISRETGGKNYILNSVCDHRKRIVYLENLYCGYTQNGGTAVVSLRQGDVVAVKSDKSGTLAGNGLSTFSGYLLQPRM